MEKQREQTYGHGEKGGEGELYGKSNMETNITMCKIESQGESLCDSGNSNTGLCNNLEGWEMGGRSKREGIYVYL